jgi:hypothetical protein
MPASCAAPGERSAPPTTTTWPRPYFESPPPGRVHSRSRFGVMTVGAGVDSARASDVCADVCADRAVASSTCSADAVDVALVSVSVSVLVLVLVSVSLMLFLR